jgi:L-fuconolactonase
MLQDIAQHDWILEPKLEPALAAIAGAGLVFDALALSHQIGVVEELARRFPDISIVLDHGAKPKLGDAAAMQQWRSDMAKLAARANVACKLSGLLTELPEGVPVERVREAANTLFDLFGPARLLWGSDWPVLTTARTKANYRDWFGIAHEIIAAHDAVATVMGANALRIYRPSRAGIAR